MNKNSKLCVYLSEHMDWAEKLQNEYGIIVKQRGPYAIFNYGIKCNFADPIVQESRGIIIDIETLEVVCWPFRKFGEYTESYADHIDWSTAVVQDKIDGSIIKMWHDGIKWVFSTNSMIYSAEAIVDQDTCKTFTDLIEESDNYQDLLKRSYSLDRDFTYIFELVSPESQVVVKYPQCHLYHTGTRSNITGQEVIMDIGIDKPEEYQLHSLDECIKAAEKLNYSADGIVRDVRKEGYVVVDRYWNRIKVKSPDYLMLHFMAANANVSKERLVQIILDGKISVQDMCAAFPNLAHFFKYYDFKVTELQYQAHAFCDLTRRIYKKTGCDRKAIANMIKNHKLSYIGFKCLNNSLPGEEILRQQTLHQYCKYISTYTPVRIWDSEAVI